MRPGEVRGELTFPEQYQAGGGWRGGVATFKVKLHVK